MISGESVRRAISHLSTFGDTDLFPRLPEMMCFMEQSDQIAADCEKINIREYKPTGAIETLTPKSWLGFRIAHQLTPSDNVIYLASLLDCAPQLENSRTKKEENEAFSYRYVAGTGPKIFESGRGYHHWLSHLAEFGGPENPFSEDRPSISTDISDFYQRIYFHRIENILSDAECPSGASNLLKKIIKEIRARQSYGLPVGNTASRLLAECLLNDTDTFLKNIGVNFSRYVDDFRIAIPPGMEAHSVLCKLSEHLMVTEGLSLNVSKTRLTTVREIERNSKSKLNDVFTTAEMEKMQAFLTIAYGGDEDVEDENLISNPFLSAEILQDRLDLMGDKRNIDLSVFKAILRALRLLPNIDSKRIVEKHADLLYYVPREFCSVLSSASKQDNFPAEFVKQRVRNLIAMPPYADLSYVRSWLINMFVDGTLPVFLPEWRDYDFTRSVIERRAKHFLYGIGADRSYFRSLKTQLGAFGEWEKPALLMAAMCLPKDEYKTWINASVNQLSTPFANTYLKWLSGNHGRLREILSAKTKDKPF